MLKKVQEKIRYIGSIVNERWTTGDAKKKFFWKKKRENLKLEFIYIILDHLQYISKLFVMEV